MELSNLVEPALRPPDLVMRLSRLGSMHQCRLSFMRTLTRRMAREGWAFSRPTFEIDDRGVGHAVYVAQGPERAYSLVAFAHDIPDEMRSDRVIATMWDATFTLFDGIPSEDDLDRLSRNVPLQEAGRVDERSLSVSRANRSVRLWDHVVGALADGRQPDVERIDAVGYLMRTTAVYGSGKLGAADFETLASRPEMGVPFQAEMLSVWLTRTFVRDLANHAARLRGGERAAELAPEIARRLGIGNSTGLGLGPFIVNHPALFNNWIMARETAIARVRALPTASPAEIARFGDIFERAARLADIWRSEHPVQLARLSGLREDIARIRRHLATDPLSGNRPWDRLIGWSGETLGEEGQEFLASLILEPYGELVDDLAATMSDTDPDGSAIDGTMTVAELRALIEAQYGWALQTDWSAPENIARAWYVSEEKLEPRLGDRFEEPIAPYEQPLAPGRDAAALHSALAGWPDGALVAELLLRHPEHRHIVRRAQIARRAPYAEIRDNTIGADLFPVDLLRCKLAFFGATRFDPRSDRWVRICMFGGAPYPEELTPSNADLWVYPTDVP